MDKISLASEHLPQLIGLVLMSIGYTLGNKFYLPDVNKKQVFNLAIENRLIIKFDHIFNYLINSYVTLMYLNNRERVK